MKNVPPKPKPNRFEISIQRESGTKADKKADKKAAAVEL